jgi:hypothetical protein
MSLGSPSRHALLVGTLFAVLATGCAARREAELLQAEIRSKDDMIRDLDNQLDKTRSELLIARRDADELRNRVQMAGGSVIAPEAASVIYGTTRLKFNAFMTSGDDVDRDGIDDRLEVLLIPMDDRNDLMKCPGSISIDVYDMALPEDERIIGQWVFSEEETAAHWHRGAVAAGYKFHLDWQQRPKHEQLTLHAQLTTPDKRKFDATMQIKVRLASSASARRTPAEDLSVRRFGTATVRPAAASRQQPPRIRPADKIGKSAVEELPPDAPTSDSFTVDDFPVRR